MTPIKLVDYELTRPEPVLGDLERWMSIRALVRLRGRPVGWLDVPIHNGTCPSLASLAVPALGVEIHRRLCADGLASVERPRDWTVAGLLALPDAPVSPDLPRLTVAICTRDRTEDLRRCLSAVACQDYPNLEILVVDNAPGSPATRRLVDGEFPQVRYLREDRPGLDWARNRAIVEATGEILAYVDDDTIPDRGWARVLGATFAEEPDAAAVTGLVVPWELETPAQWLFELRGGFGKGFRRRWFRGVLPPRRLPWHALGTGNCGTGANMAFRRDVLRALGGFDPALDAGTSTRGAGDLDLFFRVLKSGGDLLYEPAALVRHRHRREMAELERQIRDNGSVFAYIRRNLRAFPDQRRQFVRLGAEWFIRRLAKDWLRSCVSPQRYPRALRRAELAGCLHGLRTYGPAEREARRIASEMGELQVAVSPNGERSSASLPAGSGIAVRHVELREPLRPLENLGAFAAVRVYGMWNGAPLGFCQVPCPRGHVGARELAEELSAAIGLKLHRPDAELDAGQRWARMMAALHDSLGGGEGEPSPGLDPAVPVSVVVGTYDRPDDLRRCLRSLRTQKTSRPLQIVVTDNHPASGLTRPVLEEFPEVELVEEPRQGVAYARNAGFLACTGEIIVTTDDDVTMPPQWLEALLVSFSRPEVMLVNGNILPARLDTRSQRIFESYGGLGRGFEPREVDARWFETGGLRSVPTWTLGATANSAFRTAALGHPGIGLMDEALGPGMPSGVGEDIYLYYKVLKAGYTIRYEPGAFVWHSHRETPRALRRQLYNYSKGFVSYQLTTLCRDGDLRALWTLLLDLPRYHYRRLRRSIRGRGVYPVSVSMTEIAGNLAGPFAWWRSLRRVRRLGRSGDQGPPTAAGPLRATEAGPARARRRAARRKHVSPIS